MAVIPLVSGVEPVADLKINDNAPLAMSQVSKLDIAKIPLVGDLRKPIDQCSFSQLELGVNISAPSMLVAPDAKFTLTAGTAATLSIRNVQSKTLFDNDDFSPSIVIAPNECWAGLKFETSATAKLGASLDGFGVAFAASSSVAPTTFVRLQALAGQLPSLTEGIRTVVENYSVACTPHALRTQPLGIAHETDATGTVKFTDSYALPVNVNPLASAGLPFNYKLSLTPKVTLQVSGSIALTGEFIVRSQRAGETKLLLGVYKKRGTTLEVAFEAGAALTGEIGATASSGTDVLSAFLKAVSPGVSVADAGFGEEQEAALRSALRDCASTTLGVALNAACTASKVDEAAIVYEIDLATGVPETDAALAAALAGNWTLLGSLPNATPIRNICKETNEFKHRITINLFGFYNALAVDDYLKSCEILHDQNGQIVLIDKARASQVQLVGMPHRANNEKLRSALAREFLATLTYAASASPATGPKLRLDDFSVQQTFDRYDAETSGAEIRREVLLGRALGLISGADWEGELAAGQSFSHAKCRVSARYGLAAASLLFFADPAARRAYTTDQFERAGRAAMASLLHPNETNAAERLKALHDDGIWQALNKLGNTALFGDVPGLIGFNEPALGAIAGDWKDITWWSGSMAHVAPKLTQVLLAIDASTTADPASDPRFMQARENLENVLGDVAKNTRAAFAEGWGLLVMYQLSNGAPALQMDLAWNKTSRHYESGDKAAAAAPSA